MADDGDESVSTAYPDGFDKGVRVATNMAHKIGCIEGNVSIRLQEVSNITSPTGTNTRQIELLKKLQRLCAEISLEPHETDLTEKIAMIEKLAKQAKLVLPTLAVDDEQRDSEKSAPVDGAKLIF